MKQASAVVNFALRYSLPKENNMNMGEVYFNRLAKELGTTLITMGAIKYGFQLESTREDTHEDGGNYHFQGGFKLKNKDRATALIKMINYTNFRGAYIAASHSTIGVSAYGMKEETRKLGPWCQDDLLNTYKGEDLPKTLLFWQKMLENYILGPVCDRTIVWIADMDGNSGKSKYCKYMDYVHNTKTIGYSDSKDAMYMVSNSPGEKAYFFDLTRTKPKMFSTGDLYSSIEMCKNGHFMNSKYESKVVLMRPPHIVVFANTLPEMNSLSMDRWSIYELRKGLPILVKGLPVLDPKGCEELKLEPERKNDVIHITDKLEKYYNSSKVGKTNPYEQFDMDINMM